MTVRISKHLRLGSSPRAGRDGAHHVPLLRRRLRRAGDAGRQGRRGHQGRSRASGQRRAPVLQGLGAGRDAGARDAAAASRSSTARARAGLPRSIMWPRVLQPIRAEHGPEAIAFYLSGQLLTEDYYVANKLAKGFIGTPHVDTNSRLCMASSVAGHRRAFGADVVPQCYDDLELADLVVLAGSNAAWCHPVLYQRIQTARAERGVRVVNIDPRRTATCEGADLHLPIKPGTDGYLWSGLLVWLAERRLIDAAFIEEHTRGFAWALRRALRSLRPISMLSPMQPGIDRQAIAVFYGWFASTSRVVSCYSQGVNQSAQGTDKVNAIINCHLATGRIGKPGSGPLSLTGQPNAMGGREVGGLANMLAAHMGFSEAERDRVRRFWNAPNLVQRPGPQGRRHVRCGRRRPHQGAVGDGHQSRGVAAARRCGAGGAGQARPAGRLRECRRQRHGGPRACAPAGRRVGREGRHGHQLRAVHLAPARVPAAAGQRAARLVDAERGGAAARLRRGVRLPLGRRDFRTSTRGCPGFENEGERAFDISGADGLEQRGFRPRCEPFQWPLRGGDAPTPRLFADGGFFTEDARRASWPSRRRACAAAVSDEWPFVLNTGRVRDQWHTMTRTGLSPRLSTHIAEPFVEIHPDDAARLGLEQGTLAQGRNRAWLRSLARPGQPGPAAGHAVRADALVGREQLRGPHRRAGAAGDRSVLRPARGQGDAGAHRAAARRRTTASCCRASALQPDALAYWARARAAFGHILNFALDEPPTGWSAWLRATLPAGDTHDLPRCRRRHPSRRRAAGWTPGGAGVRRRRARSCRRPIG